MTPSGVGLIAAAYARRGWPVLPLQVPEAGGCSCRRHGCSSSGKHPRLPHGMHEASTDLDVVRRWWQRWPAANVGVVTGVRSGVFIVDIDGEAGWASLTALQREWGALGAPGLVRTSSLSVHAWYRHPGGHLGNTAGRLGSGLETRGDGGYVVAPPSVHMSGQRYWWLRAGEIPAMPSWLLTLLRPLPRPVPGGRGPSGVARTNYARAALDGELVAVTGAAVGCRNHQLNVSVFKLGTLVATGALDEESVVDVLVAAAASCRLSEREAMATVRSGIGAGLRAPRGAST